MRARPITWLVSLLAVLACSYALAQTGAAPGGAGTAKSQTSDRNPPVPWPRPLGASLISPASGSRKCRRPRASIRAIRSPRIKTWSR